MAAYCNIQYIPENKMGCFILMSDWWKKFASSSYSVIIGNYI